MHSIDQCEHCLNTHFSCAWCTDKVGKERVLSQSVTLSISLLLSLQAYEVVYRCLSRETLLSFNCSETHIYENQPQLELLQQRPLKDYETRDEQAVQVQPQRVFLKLVKGNLIVRLSLSLSFSPLSPYSPHSLHTHPTLPVRTCVSTVSVSERESVCAAFFGTVFELCHRFVCSADLSHFI